MVVRIFIGVGLFVLGYFVGKEIGRAESIRDQLTWAAEEDDPVSMKPESVGDSRSAVSEPDFSGEAAEERGRS